MLPKANVELNLCRDAEASGSRSQQSTDASFVLADMAATQDFGAALAKQLPSGALVLLKGPLGAGKTSLVQGMAQALNINEPITSPTFAIAQHYPQGSPPLIHLDLYRLDNPAAADEIFCQEEEEARRMGAVMVVEWPERLGIEIAPAWHVELRYFNEDQRKASLRWIST
ncbi:tRNA (adenosine(37)-N6)-threonylcarbamoyltransferase complex ATPase subunit type 1 TsaE [Synechococcus sp. MU1611]|nr:tRNA (adenosine(37)-N6)-threonylcarbamoyltransferase complex ATPase subunit type 1 TsaE [Synechococcus sp. MU1611]